MKNVRFPRLIPIKWSQYGLISGIILFYYCQTVCAQDDALVTLSNKGRDALFYLLEYRSQTAIDSAWIPTDSTASFHGHTPYPLLGIRTKNSPDKYYFFHDRGRFACVEYNNPKDIQVTNSELDRIWRASRDKQTADLKIIRPLRAGTNESDSLFLRKKNEYEKWGYEQFLSLMQRDTFLALRFINFYLPTLQEIVFANPLYLDSLKNYFALLPVKNHPLLEKNDPVKQMEDLSYLRIGTAIHEFKLIDPQQDTIGTTQFRGNTLLLDFGASWCGPCRAKNQLLKQHYAALKQKNINILSVSLDQKMEVWLSAVEKDKLPWTQGILISEQRESIQKEYNAHAIPLTLLFSKEGRLLVINPKLETLLK